MCVVHLVIKNLRGVLSWAVVFCVSGKTLFGTGGMMDASDDESCPAGAPCKPTIDTIINNISHTGNSPPQCTNSTVVWSLRNLHSHVAIVLRASAFVSVKGEMVCALHLWD